ncbi:MAG TPA: hypothetical protein PK875_03040 [Spirochaetota bacterium]|jgi:hypothetical protein|nr:hypothetical protein [Spirochaetota bacterium]OPZ37890.1 MAG: hypothetical protein BWY96_01475 [Spirochaetes bacterium ADurb.BinA120]HPI15022.1 hypothetical protein [Spirochaetota bacterium]HPO44750.1 hypothetical protein [Spirochaetota bacterium]HPV97557.1 hypothetical protein [Spirochaetota bacterium]
MNKQNKQNKKTPSATRTVQRDIGAAMVRNLEKCASLTSTLFAMKTSLYQTLYPNSDREEIRSLLLRDILRRKSGR